jgi:hypothetical protein
MISFKDFKSFPLMASSRPFPEAEHSWPFIIEMEKRSRQQKWAKTLILFFFMGKSSLWFTLVLYNIKNNQN